MDNPGQARIRVLQALENVAARAERPVARLLAVSKTKPVESIRAMAADGQRAFGENYVQEAMAKREALADLGLEWHLIGHLQSNKARDAAATFDWVQSVDRLRLVDALAQHRPADQPPLNVLLQVNVDAEAGKSGCRPDQMQALVEAIDAAATLRLRGLMAITEAFPDLEQRRASFRRLRELFDALRVGRAAVDTLSMGMSEDYLLAAQEGATMVRVGSALFGSRKAQ